MRSLESVSVSGLDGAFSGHAMMSPLSLRVSTDSICVIHMACESAGLGGGAPKGGQRCAYVVGQIRVGRDGEAAGAELVRHAGDGAAVPARRSEREGRKEG